ncbi:asparaginase [Shimia thalassica]|uniref:L-asparaginase II n=1 Tax=Shimia thalassica TaxID=1715693 RepID=A0A0P1IHI7_9RHOB|nr:asparaginase [Shimia thalassica]MDP2495682.1 asparaginase [Shimia thalassica]MDP2519880.1 asparaginase [Shimia thalassica]CUK13020.1 L-asparaginase II [Shimia thalassica]
MATAVPMVEIWRGPFLESMHSGHAVVCDDTGQIVESWGDPEAVVLPRSSSKMLQALPLLESGAAADAGLTDEQLALACASHNGSEIHSVRVKAWLEALGKSDEDFRCGPQEPRDIAVRDALIREDKPVCRYHNNCSGKHSGFLTLTKYLNAGPDYVAVDHPVQKAVKAAFEEVTQEDTPGYGIDGCSAPNFATTMHGMARAMAFFAGANPDGGARESAAAKLTRAMATYPELVAGEGRACTDLMRAMDHKVAVKTGAEAYFIAIVPEKKMGVAVKILDGSTRGAECAIASILVRLGVLDPAHPLAQKYINAPIQNWDGLVTGRMKPVEGFI